MTHIEHLKPLSNSTKGYLIDKDDDSETNPNYMPTTLHKYENGYALLIGLSYKHWLPRKGHLKGTINDINNLKAHFLDENKAAFLEKNVTVLTDQTATATNIWAALDDLAQKAAADPKASVLIYFSGHGASDGENHFLVPYDMGGLEIDDYRQNNHFFKPEQVILSTVFTQKLDNIKARKCLIILDCCHAENMPVDKSLGKAEPDFIANFTQDIPVSVTEKSIGSQIAQGNGRIILTSCKGEETSLDIGSNGLFTKILLECLNGEGNLKKDGWVRLIDLIDYVPNKVATEAPKYVYGHSQHPVFKRIENMEEEFIICAYNIAQAKGIDTPTPVTPTIHKAPITMPVQAFKAQLRKQLDDEQQDAISDILIAIEESPYKYNKVKCRQIYKDKDAKNASPHDLVDNTKLLIHSLQEGGL